VGHYQAAGKAGKAKDPEKKKKEITLALEYFIKAAEIDPTNMAYVSNRSACYYELKDYDKVGRHPTATFQYRSTTLCQSTYHIQ
jgi:hypothetical protein